MVNLSLAAIATAGIAFISTTSAVITTSSAGFAASDGSINFALNIPQKDDNEDLYFTIYGPSSSSWIAIGMGSDKMDDSLMFMVYADSTGKNVTISPRLSYGHVEPSYTSNISITTLPGTGISNGNYTVNAMCKNCRSWKGGKIDPTSTKANFIFGAGPDGSLNTNDLSAGIKRHSLYGTFTMDLTRAVGASGVPIAVPLDTTGTVQNQDKSDHDFSAALHACLMILAFVGLMPIGVLILRIMNSPKWHGYNQTASAIVAILGVFLGIYSGMMYNRSKNWNSGHQIFGLVIIVGLIGQFVLGFMHHRIYKRTLATTKLAPIHVWLGRLVIPAGIANGFLGFPLALNTKYNWALLALVLLVIIVLGPFAFWRWRRDAQKRKTNLATMGGHGSDSEGYQSQPWTSSAGPSQSDINLGSYGQGGYPASGQNHPPIYQHPEQGRSFA